MTIVVGLGAVVGLIAAVRWKTSIRALAGLAVGALFLALQLIALRVSFIPYIARR